MLLLSYSNYYLIIEKLILRNFFYLLTHIKHKICILLTINNNICVIFKDEIMHNIHSIRQEDRTTKLHKFIDDIFDVQVKKKLTFKKTTQSDYNYKHNYYFLQMMT